MKRTQQTDGLDALNSEHGTILKQGSFAAAIGYPAPYRVGASSLGAQFVYKLLNRVEDLSCTRFFLRDDGTANRPPVSIESNRPISDMHALFFSISCEQELLGIVRLLSAAGLAPLACDRKETDPTVIVGGPLTMVDPRLVAPLSDMVVIGHADHLIEPVGELLVSHTGDKVSLLQRAAALSASIYIPAFRSAPPDDLEMYAPRFPASAAVWSEDAELKNLFLVEATRGCRRRCAFCTMSQTAKRTPCFQAFPIEDILSQIPADAPGVGLVGAAVTDHPEIEKLVETLVKTGRRVSLSSIRADRLTENLARLLKNGGLRTLTVAADGASERVRKSIHKGITETHLKNAADIAQNLGFAGLKIYSMVGLPDEKDSDVEEFADLLLSMTSHVKVSATVQAFVPKPGTPLEAVPMEKVSIIEHRLDLLRRRTRGRVKFLPTSPKWSFIDWKLAHGGFAAAQAAIFADEDGASFAAWKKAIKRFIQ